MMCVLISQLLFVFKYVNKDVSESCIIYRKDVYLNNAILSKYIE